MNEQHSHCSCCGTPYAEKTWPRICQSCDHHQWHNPTPIAVLLQPVHDGGRIGILAPIRGIQPQQGQPGLVGGFQEAHDQSSEAAALREMQEETGIDLTASADLYPICTRSTGPMIPGRRQNLVFIANHETLDIKAFEQFEPNAETSAIHIAWESQALCFPSHSYALALWFKMQGQPTNEMLLDQPQVGDRVGMQNHIVNLPYHQPLCERGIWWADTAQGMMMLKRGARSWILA